MQSLNSILNMPEVTLTLKCGVISGNGIIDANSYKFLTWSYVCDNAAESYFSHVPLNERVLSVYPNLIDETTRIVYIGNKKCSISY